MRGYNEHYHFRIFNVIVRLFGIMMMVFAVNCTGWGIYYHTHPKETEKREAEEREAASRPHQPFSRHTISSDVLGGIVTEHIAIGIFAGVLAIAVLRVRPHRPDLDSSTFSSSAGPRSWWTGEPKS